MSSEISDQNTA